MRSLKWGVVGLGIGDRHATAIANLPGCELAAICDQDPAVLDAAAGRFPRVLRFEDPLDLISFSGLDAVVVASYDDSHAAIVIEALRNQLHVFVEKPAATSMDDLETIVALLNQDPHLRMTSNTLLRRSPRFVWLKNQIDQGRFGHIYHSEMNYLYGRLDKHILGWRGSSPHYSVALGGAIHLVDLQLWLTRELPSECVAIRSSLASRCHPDVPRIEDVPDDLCMALLSYPSGRTAQLGANFGGVLPHFHSVAVFGTAGTFLNYPSTPGAVGAGVYSSPALVFSDRNPESPPEAVDLAYPAVPKSTLLAQFVKSIGGTFADKADETISEQEVIDATAVALSMDAAASQGTTVPIRYPEVSPRAVER